MAVGKSTVNGCVVNGIKPRSAAHLSADIAAGVSMSATIAAPRHMLSYAAVSNSASATLLTNLKLSAECKSTAKVTADARALAMLACHAVINTVAQAEISVPQKTQAHCVVRVGVSAELSALISLKASLNPITNIRSRMDYKEAPAHQAFITTIPSPVVVTLHQKTAVVFGGFFE